MLVNSLSSPSYLQGSLLHSGAGEAAPEATPEQELQDFIARNPELFQQPVRAHPL